MIAQTLPPPPTNEVQPNIKARSRGGTSEGSRWGKHDGRMREHFTSGATIRFTSSGPHPPLLLINSEHIRTYVAHAPMITHQHPTSIKTLRHGFFCSPWFPRGMQPLHPVQKSTASDDSNRLSRLFIQATKQLQVCQRVWSIMSSRGSSKMLSAGDRLHCDALLRKNFDRSFSHSHLPRARKKETKKRSKKRKRCT